MITIIATKITNFIQADSNYRNIDRVVYLYGIYQGLVILINMTTIIIIGLVLGAIIYVLTFTVAYTFLRLFAGGYHASTLVRCYLATISMVVLVASLSLNVHLSEWAIAVLLIVVGASIILLSPVDSANKRLDELEKMVYKRRTTKICLFEVVIAIAVLPFGLRFVSVGIFWALVVVLLLLVLELLKGTKK